MSTGDTASPTRCKSHPSSVVDLQSSPANSSASSSPSSSVPNSPAASATLHQRPSSLHVINHKVPGVKNFRSSTNRRKSVGHVPVSPLARTPSPSPVPASPTRSPSPHVPMHHHHHHHYHHHCPGSSNTTQTYSPGSSLTPSKKCINRPKSAEPGSPLLRRALSPDRLHPRSAEIKATPTISPLATPPKPSTGGATHTPPRLTISASVGITSSAADSATPSSSALAGTMRSPNPTLLTQRFSPASTLEEAPEELDSPGSGSGNTDSAAKEDAKNGNTSEILNVSLPSITPSDTHTNTVEIASATPSLDSKETPSTSGSSSNNASTSSSCGGGDTPGGDSSRQCSEGKEDGDVNDARTAQEKRELFKALKEP